VYVKALDYEIDYTLISIIIPEKYAADMADMADCTA